MAWLVEAIMRDHNAGRYWDLNLNDVYGCAPVSSGCRNCWSACMAYQYSSCGRKGPYAGLVRMGQHGPEWNGQIKVRADDALNVPGLRGVDPGRIIMLGFMCDLLHKDVPIHVWDRILRRCAGHAKDTFIVATKRPENLVKKIPQYSDMTRYYPNFHVMISAETQQDYHARLAAVPEDFGRVLISAEPLLGQILLASCTHYPARLAGVIVGGENGHNARPMNAGWVRSLRDQCKALSIPFYFKGWGEYIACPVCQGEDHSCSCYRNQWPGWVKAPEHYRTLDGRQHNDFPF